MQAKYHGYTFELDPAVDRKLVRFVNRFGINLAGDLYTPKDKEAIKGYIAISGPFGAVKEQASGLYANELARRGFVTLAFDPSFTGLSGGNVRNVASPDINTDDFSAAVDYLITQENALDKGVGILGICGWGGIALNAASMDPRIQATVASTMYNMSRVTRNGYFDADDDDDKRYAMKQALASQRTRDYASGVYQRAGGVIEEVPEDAPSYIKDYHDYYKTERGYSERSLNSNAGWNATSALSLINDPLDSFIDEIRTPVLLVHGEKAHSRYFSEDAYKQLKGDNKELVIIPDAVHTDLYDQKDKIPFDKIEEFYEQSFAREK